MASTRLREHIDLFDDPPWKARQAPATPDEVNPPEYVASAALAILLSVAVIVPVVTVLIILSWGGLAWFVH
jgi:hypothetical protein